MTTVITAARQKIAGLHAKLRQKNIQMSGLERELANTQDSLAKLWDENEKLHVELQVMQKRHSEVGLADEIADASNNTQGTTFAKPQHPLREPQDEDVQNITERPDLQDEQEQTAMEDQSNPAAAQVRKKRKTRRWTALSVLLHITGFIFLAVSFLFQT